MKKEKIILKIRGLGIGGIERLTIDLLNNLKIKNKELVLCLESNIENALEGQLDKNIEKVYLLPEKFETHFNKIKKLKCNKKNLFNRIYLSILLELKRRIINYNLNKYIEKNKVKVFIDYSGHSISKIKSIRNVKKILWIHLSINNLSEKEKNRYINKIKNYDKIIAVCEEIKSEILEIAPELTKKIEVIYNFIDKEKIEKKLEERIPIEDKKLMEDNYCMMLGRLDKVKDYKTAIKAFKILSDKGIKEKLYIVGEGAIREELNVFIKKQGLSNQILLLGMRENPYLLLKRAKIFIHTSKLEGFGLVLTEAGICKTLVISSKYKCGAKEILEDGKNGILFEIGDYQKLAKNIEDTLLNKIDKEMYIENFYKSIDNFSKKKIIEKYKKLIEGM